MSPSCVAPKVVFLTRAPICQHLALQSPQGKFFKYTVGNLHVVDVHKISSLYIHYCRNGSGGLGRASGGIIYASRAIAAVTGTSDHVI